MSRLLTLGALAQAQRGFNPASLFRDGEQGIFAPIRPDNVFTDTAGTTLADPGDPVARVDDLSGNDNHATQATVESRPVFGREPFGGRRNAFVQTEALDVSPWLLRSSSLTDLGGGEFRLTPNPDTTDNHNVRQVTDTSVPFKEGMNSMQIEAKADGGRWLRFRVASTSGGGTRPGTSVANFDLLNGVLGDINTGGGTVDNTHSIEDLGGDWYRCTFNFTVTGEGFFDLQFAILATDTTSDFPSEPAAEKGPILLRRPNANATPEITPYQRVVSAFDVTEAGVATIYYLAFDGVDDYLVTPSITPGTDKAQVFAGVRKLSDAENAMLWETGTSFGNGSAHMFAPDGSNSYRFRSRGTVTVTLNATGFSAPVSNVVTALSEISAPFADLRVDGATVASSSADQGTGDFLDHQLHIGSRGGVSVFFNGNIYGLIARFGPNLSPAEIERTERWLAARTGVTL